MAKERRIEKLPKVKEQAPVPHTPRRPAPIDIRLSARQYVRSCGYRWERSAGFLREMKHDSPGLKTRPEWSKLWDAFWARPVK